jgi:HAD superfamily hydrolase (TIGR01450 family)
MDISTLKSCRLFLLDMDGTIYLGDRPLPGAVDFVEYLRSSGRRYIYLTNNSSRSAPDYVVRLQSMGFPCRLEDVFTSGMATALYLREQYPGAGIYPVGTRAFCRELESYGLKLTDSAPEVVCVGFDRELTYEKLEKAVRFLRKGASFIAANPDLVCPMPDDEVLPDCGSICALLAAATGREPLYIGKPHSRMVDIISKQTGVPNNLIAMVGDRLYTDMAVAKNAGAVSVCLLSGETTREMLDASPVKPDYVFLNAAELHAALI